MDPFTLKAAAAIVAAALAIVGNVPYIRDIFSGKVKPHPYTWFVWTLVSGIIFFGQLAKGAGVGVLPTAASEIFTLFIFLFSLRYGFRDISHLDTAFLGLAIAGIAIWLLTADPTLSVVIAVAIDTIAFVPTLRKTWARPRTENPMLFGSNVARHILALCSLEAYNVATMLHSVVMVILNSAMTAIILGRRGNRQAP
jgi:hypothetical protein